MLHLDASSDIPLYQQIYEQIRQDIMSGSLRRGARLPSTRSLAVELGAGRNTVENAYAQLALEGYVSGRPRAAFVVNDVQQFPHLRKPAAFEHTADTPARSKIFYDFHYGVTEPGAFPLQLWRKLSHEALEKSRTGMHSYGELQGHARLRAEIAEYLYRSRGVRCSPGQVVVTSGFQASLSVICDLVLRAECAIAMEEPGYRGARVVFQGNGFPLQPIPVHEDGLDIDVLRASRVQAVYVTPSHQFPMGAVLPIRKRVELLRWASESDALIIEDDYDSEFRYNGRPVPSLQSIDGEGRVIYLGTFSKALSPGLRTAYLVLPERLLPEYKQRFSGCVNTVPWLEQHVLAAFMAEGHWEKHLRRTCASNRKKHDMLVDAVSRAFGNAVRIHGQGAGVHLLLEFPEGAREEELAARAETMGVRVYPASPHWLETSSYAGNCLFLGFAVLQAEDILPAVALLRQAWQV